MTFMRIKKKKSCAETPLVVQWLRICLRMQGTWVQSLFRELRSCVKLLLLSRVHFFATPWTATRQVSLSFTISRSFLKLMSIESVMRSHHLILCRPFSSRPRSFPACAGPTKTMSHNYGTLHSARKTQPSQDYE